MYHYLISSCARSDWAWGRREQVFEDCENGWWLLHVSKTKATRALLDARAMHHITASVLEDDKRQSAFIRVASMGEVGDASRLEIACARQMRCGAMRAIEARRYLRN